MHALIFCLLKQMVDPTMIAFKRSQAPQMSTHSTNHSWYTSDSLQEYRSVHPVSFIHFLRIVPRDKVKAPASSLDSVIGDVILNRPGFLMGGLDFLHALFTVNRMRHSVGAGIQDYLMLRQLVN